MFALSHTISSVSSRTRELSNSTLLSKKTALTFGDILTSRINMEHTNRCRELGVNHDRKTLINRENLTTRGHSKAKCSEKIIYKNNIASMTPF